MRFSEFGLVLAGAVLSGFNAHAQVVIISSDFTGVTASGTTYNNITWTGTVATSSTSSLQAIRMDNNGTQVRSIVAYNTSNAGYLTVSSGNQAESYCITMTFHATTDTYAGSLTIGWGSSGTSAAPGFGFALYDNPAPTSNLNSVAFGAGSTALGYAITGTVQPSGTGALSSAMTGNVTPVNASNLASPQSITLTLAQPVHLLAGNDYQMRVAVFESNGSVNPNIFLDSVTLNSSTVPEPSTYGMVMGLGALVWATGRRLHRAA